MIMSVPRAAARYVPIRSPPWRRGGQEGGGDEEDRSDAEERGERASGEGSDRRTQHLRARQQRERPGRTAGIGRLADEGVGGGRDGGAEGAQEEAQHEQVPDGA